MADAHRVHESRSPISFEGQFEQEVTSTDCDLQPSTLNPEANIQSRNLSLQATNLAQEEVTPENRETYSMPREEEDDNLLGRSLFEKDRDSRRSLVTELHHEITRKSNVMNEQDGPSGEVAQQVYNSVIGLQNAGQCYTASSPNQLTRMNITNSSFETSNTKAELRTQNLIEPQSNQGPVADENELERHLNEKDRKSKGHFTAKLNDPTMEGISPKWNEKVHEIDSTEDQGFNENQQFESYPFSRRMAKDVEKQSLADATMDHLITEDGTGNITSYHQHRSNSLSSTHGQTQHLRDVGRKTRPNILEEGKYESISPMEIRGEYSTQQRDERESSDCQDKLLVNEDVCEVFTHVNIKKREKSRSSFNVYDDTVPDGPVTDTSIGIDNSSNDSLSSRNTDGGDGPLKRPGNNLRVQSVFLPENVSGILTSQTHFMDETCYEEEKLRTFEQNGKKVTFRSPQLAFLGGKDLVDGGKTDSLRKEEILDGPILTGEAFTTCQDGTEGICENETASFSSNAARDNVDGRVCSPNSDANVNDPSGFGGARPNEISSNSTRRNSSIKTKMSEPILTYQHNETGEIGLNPGFLARHTENISGAILDLPPQDSRDEPFFSARACENITSGDNLGLPGERINTPGYASSSTSQGLYQQAEFAARTSTRGNAQSLAIHQKPSLNQQKSWHFPPLESPSGDQGLCASQQNECHNEYHNSMGNVDNRMVKSPAVSDVHHSSSEDSTSSLLGSLRHIMSKTVNLIASNNAVAKQPPNEPKEAVKLSIQEEARGRREQEQAVRTGVEDSRNQGESTQDNEETERQHIPTPVQETPRPVCSHYQRRCLVSFPCCGKFYPCHRCHNESKDCSNDQARATNATHIRCSICYHEQKVRV